MKRHISLLGMLFSLVLLQHTALGGLVILKVSFDVYEGATLEEHHERELIVIDLDVRTMSNQAGDVFHVVPGLISRYEILQRLFEQYFKRFNDREIRFSPHIFMETPEGDVEVFYDLTLSGNRQPLLPAVIGGGGIRIRVLDLEQRFLLVHLRGEVAAPPEARHQPNQTADSPVDGPILSAGGFAAGVQFGDSGSQR